MHPYIYTNINFDIFYTYTNTNILIYTHIYFLYVYTFYMFVHHTTSILAKLSTWCFEHPGDISCSLLVKPTHIDESWEGRNTCLRMYIIFVPLYNICRESSALLYGEGQSFEKSF